MFSKFDNPIEEIFNLKLLKSLYASDEAYETQIEEGIDAWTLPYNAIREFLLPIVIISNKTLSLDAILRFIDYYYKNQENYSEDYRLNPMQYEMLKLVVQEEITRGEFHSSVEVLNEKQGLVSIKTPRTKFMKEKAEEFLTELSRGKIKPPILVVESKLDLTSSAAQIAFEYGFHEITIQSD